jgi:hypothetical protein
MWNLGNRKYFLPVGSCRVACVLLAPPYLFFFDLQ